MSQASLVVSSKVALVGAVILGQYELRHVLATVTTPLFRLVGAEADVKAVFVEWMRIPGLLMQLEDSLRASGVPLSKDTP